jgi:hypothetical protein
VKQPGVIDPEHLLPPQQTETAEFGKSKIAFLCIAVNTVDCPSISAKKLRYPVRRLLTEIAFSDKQISRKKASFFDLLKQDLKFISFVNRHGVTINKCILYIKNRLKDRGLDPAEKTPQDKSFSLSLLTTTQGRIHLEKFKSYITNCRTILAYILPCLIEQKISSGKFLCCRVS